MTFSKVFAEENIVPELEAQHKEEAIKELVSALVASQSVPKSLAAGVEKAVLRREELGSTGIGNGVAVPHAKVAGVKGVIGALGRSTAGVDFSAIDGRRVQLMFLLVSGPDMAEGHLRALRKVTALLKDNDFVSFMRRAKDKTELAELLHEAEERVSA